MFTTSVKRYREIDQNNPYVRHYRFNLFYLFFSLFIDTEQKSRKKANVAGRVDKGFSLADNNESNRLKCPKTPEAASLVTPNLT